MKAWQSYILSLFHAHLVVLLWFLLCDQSDFIKNNLWTSKLVMVFLHLRLIKIIGMHGQAKRVWLPHLFVEMTKDRIWPFCRDFFLRAHKRLFYSIVSRVKIFKVKVPVKEYKVLHSIILKTSFLIALAGF